MKGLWGARAGGAAASSTEEGVALGAVPWVPWPQLAAAPQAAAAGPHPAAKHQEAQRAEQGQPRHYRPHGRPVAGARRRCRAAWRPACGSQRCAARLSALPCVGAVALQQRAADGASGELGEEEGRRGERGEDALPAGRRHRHRVVVPAGGGIARRAGRPQSAGPAGGPKPSILAPLHRCHSLSNSRRPPSPARAPDRLPQRQRGDKERGGPGAVERDHEERREGRHVPSCGEHMGRKDG